MKPEILINEHFHAEYARQIEQKCNLSLQQHREMGLCWALAANVADGLELNCKGCKNYKGE